MLVGEFEKRQYDRFLIHADFSDNMDIAGGENLIFANTSVTARNASGDPDLLVIDDAYRAIGGAGNEGKLYILVKEGFVAPASPYTITFKTGQTTTGEQWEKDVRLIINESIEHEFRKQPSEAWGIYADFSDPSIVDIVGDNLVEGNCAVIANDKDQVNVSSTLLDQTTKQIGTGAEKGRLIIKVRAGSEAASPYTIQFQTGALESANGEQFEVAITLNVVDL